MTLSRVRTLPPGAERERYLPLLYLADDSSAHVHGYYQLGDLYAVDDDVGAPVAVVLAIAQAQHGVVELKSVAVATPLQRHGLGRQLLIAVLDELRLRGTRRVVVGASSSSIGALAFYQRAGFRVWKVERDFFCPARGYPPGLEEGGIPVRDMLWLDQDLSDSSFRSQRAPEKFG
jgi:ribosomal protein S18 acetylase RimI-like enzyme